MSNFNSADIAAFKDVWVFCEQREGKLMPTDFELISKGRDLANELGVNLCGLLLGGEGIESAAKELGGYGADKVIVCESPLLATYTTDGYAKVICDVIEDLKPEAFLIGATNIGRDLGPRCAARLHTGLCADCTHLDVDVPNYIQFLRESSTLDVDSMKWDMEDRNLKMTRPAFGGHLMATIICPRFRPCMATVRPGVMKKNAFDEAKANAVEIVKPNFTLTAEDIHTDVTEVVKAAKKLVDLIGADFIVSVGRGISKDVEGGIKLAEGDYVIGAARARKDAYVLSITENGYGKRTPVEEFTVHHRGGGGMMLHNLTEKTGLVAGIAVVDSENDVMIITDDGVIIRTGVEEIRECGRGSQGVIVMRTGTDVKVISIARTDKEEEAPAEAEEETAESAENAESTEE